MKEKLASNLVKSVKLISKEYITLLDLRHLGIPRRKSIQNEILFFILSHKKIHISEARDCLVILNNSTEIGTIMLQLYENDYLISKNQANFSSTFRLQKILQVPIDKEKSESFFTYLENTL